MAASTSARPFERGDRYVRRGRLRIGARTSRTLAEFSLAEALRLVRLPGEDEGRVYVFRRVRLRGVPADGNRGAWQAQLHRALHDLAAEAVHGSEPRAVAAPAVYFARRQEALEILLCRIVRDEACDAWFWPLVCERRTAGPLAAVVDALRAQDGTWSRVAAALFRAASACGARAVVTALPAADVERWLAELGDARSSDERASPLALPADVRASLIEAVARFGAADPRVVVLAAFAAVLASPSAVERRTALAHGRATLRAIAERLPRIDAASPDAMTPRVGIANRTEADAPPRPGGAPPRELAFDDEREEASTAPAARDDDAAHAPHPHAAPSRERARRADAGALEPRRIPVHGGAVLASGAGTTVRSGDVSPAAVAPRARTDAEAAAVVPARGARTNAAGLFFLLNALARLGFAGELRANPDLDERGFAVRVLRHLAEHAAPDRGDPVFGALGTLAGEFDPAAPDDAADEALARMWARAVRRWCCERGRVTARHVVRRSGRIELTRTELDVTLPLRATDLRVRRIGLDFDPGWLPWLRRVVRFQYAGEEDGTTC